MEVEETVTSGQVRATRLENPDYELCWYVSFVSDEGSLR
jgi:hypothetical protein